MTHFAPFPGQTSASSSAATTWRAPGPALLARVDLSGLVESGLVTSVDVMTDGALVMECPNGLPAELAGLVEPIEASVEHRLHRLERSIERIAVDLKDKARTAERIAAADLTLAERLQGVIAEEVFNLFVDQAEVGPSVAERVDAILAAVKAPRAEGEILARVQELCARDDRGQVEELSEQLAALASRVETLRPLGDLTDAVGMLADRVAALEARPAPEIDLTEQRKTMATFATAMGAALRRIETATEGLDPGLMARMAAQVEALGVDEAPIMGVLDRLGARIEALEARLQAPDPLGPALVSGLEVLAAKLDARLSAILPAVEDLAERTATLEAGLPEVLARLDALAEAGPSPVARALLSVADRAAPQPGPVQVDLTAFRAAQQDFFQDLRFLLVELAAGQVGKQARAV